jgi:ubiquinone/menaquinone biosynthesis C-methylase UbiE
VVGLDPDPKALARARHKPARAVVSTQFDEGFADELPYPEASFDWVISSFMFHHHSANEKGKALGEVRRVLKSGGEFHMLDFEGSGDGAELSGPLDSCQRPAKGNSESRVLTLMRQAGLRDPKKMGRRRMLFGTVAYYRATA